jgi:malonyl-CoA O-methyltransferase
VKACIDRIKVGSSFHRHAAEYDQHAAVQKRVINRLVSLVNSHVGADPTTILDIGCGTGQLLLSLSERYKNSSLYGLDLAYNMTRCASERLDSKSQFVNADAEYIPFRNDTFDLIVSTSTLQWFDNFELFFQQARRVIKSNGLLCAAFFGGRTLCELHECFSDVTQRRIDGSSGYVNRLHQFMKREDVESALELIDFNQATILTEIETEYYSDVFDLLRSIKRIGAGSSNHKFNAGGLGWKGILNETSRLYSERYGINGEISATYEVMYIVARGHGTV